MTRFHFSNRLTKKLKKPASKRGSNVPSNVPSTSAEAGGTEEVMSNMVLKTVDSDTKKSCSSSSSCSSFDVASDITQGSVERIFQEVDGHLSVTDTQQYQDAVEALSETELNKKLAEELDYLQELLEDEKRGEIHTDTKWVDPEAEIPWEQTHRRVLTMTVDTHKHKHGQNGHVHHHHNHDPVPINTQVPETLATKLPNRKVPLHKEFACTNLACTDPHCSDVMCGVKGLDIADKHKHHVPEPIPVNNQVPNSMATRLPNRKVPLHKEFACTNLACADPHCSDVMCGTKVTEIKSHNSDPDLYSSRYAMDTAVAHIEKTVKNEAEITSHEHEHYYGKPVLFVMDSRNKFHPLTRPQEAHKVLDVCKEYEPTKSQQHVINTLQGSEDANTAAHDILTGTFIRNCQEENLMTDVNIYIGGELFTAHRIMLAQYSSYFQELFCISKRDNNLPFNLKVKGISADAFEAFLHLVYIGDCNITSDIVMDLYMIAKRFSVDELHNRLNDYLNSLSTDNCLDIMLRGEAPTGEPLYETALKFLIRDFQKAVKKPAFLELRLDVLIKILSSDFLKIDKETEVFDAAHAWIKHDIPKREQHLSRVMECVRFALMDHLELFVLFSGVDLIQKNAYCREMMMKANWIITSRMLHFADPFDLPCPKKRDPNLLNQTPDEGLDDSLKIQPKIPKEDKLVPGDLLAFGGFFSGSDKTRAVEGAKSIMWYHVDSRNWKKLTELPEARIHHASCVLNGKIYITGGSDPKFLKESPKALASCFCFDPHTMEWTNIAPMRTPRLMHSLVALSGRLYAIGGQDINDRLLSRVECYNPDTNKWIAVASINVARIASAAAVMDGKIYLAGGYTADIKVKSGTPISSITECYDPEKQKWTRLGDIRIPRCQASLVAVGGDLYLCGGATRTHGTDFTTAASLRDIDKYSKEFDMWEKVAELDTERHACGAAAVGNKLYICGGACSAMGYMLHSMEVYDAATGKFDRTAPDCPLPGRFLSLIAVPPCAEH